MEPPLDLLAGAPQVKGASIQCDEPCFFWAAAAMVQAYGQACAAIQARGDCKEDRLFPENIRLKLYTFSVALGLVLGFVLVWWIRPTTNSGTVFIVSASTILCSLVSVVVNFAVGLFHKS
jgi:hypothetical protein